MAAGRAAEKAAAGKGSGKGESSSEGEEWVWKNRRLVNRREERREEKERRESKTGRSKAEEKELAEQEKRKEEQELEAAVLCAGTDIHCLGYTKHPSGLCQECRDTRTLAQFASSRRTFFFEQQGEVSAEQETRRGKRKRHEGEEDERE